MRRCCICVLWDNEGKVKDYVITYLKGLQDVAQTVYAVINGELSSEGRKKLEALGVEILTRENKGLDFGAWKDTINKIGYDTLNEYDELILTNTTSYGPIYPLSSMFEEMEGRDCDFWGITKHPSTKKYFIENDPNKKIIEHIQTYFLVFNKNVFQSESFRNFWENIKISNKYWDTVYFCEIKLTNYFEKAGFKSDSYVPIDEVKNVVDNIMFYSDVLLQKYKVPLVKRKAIIFDYNVLIRETLTSRVRNIMTFIKNETDYDIEQIYDDIIKSYPMSQIRKNLHLNYVLPTNCSNYEICGKRIAMILYIYYEDLVEYCFRYAQSMPEGSDIYIVCSKEKTIEMCKQKAFMLEGKNLIFRHKKNRGRDVSAYLVTCADVFKNYDYICCMHDKKSPHENELMGKDFSYQCFECNLSSKYYVKNVIELFEKKPRLGILSNPIILFHSFVNFIGNELTANRQVLKELFKKLNLSVPFDEHPVAPFGSMFWIRKEAIEPLFRHKWTYEDFPDEPLPVDGTVSHGIERLYPAIVQEAGFFSGWIMPDSFASVYIDNLYYQATKRLQFVHKIKKKKLKFIQKVFSIVNTSDKKHKMITVVGCKIKIKKKEKINAI